MTKRRFNVLHVSDQAKEFVDEMSDWSGIDRKTIADRVFNWLGHQPRELQAAILMSFPQAFQQDFAELMLRRLAQQETTDESSWLTGNKPRPEQASDSQAASTMPSDDASSTKRYAAKSNQRYSSGTRRPQPPKSDSGD